MLNANLTEICRDTDINELCAGLLATIGQPPGKYRYLIYHPAAGVVFAHNPIGKAVLHDFQLTPHRYVCR